MTIELAHTEHAPVENNSTKSSILVLGPAARELAGALLRLEANAVICSAVNLADAIELLRTKKFDHVLVDNRADGPAITLAVPRIAAVESAGKLTVLAGKTSKEQFASLHCVDTLIEAPYNPLQIAEALNIEVTDNRGNCVKDNGMRRRKDDTEVAQEPTPEIPLTNFPGTLARFIPGLTPLISLVYKNVALTMLCALFLAFISYGLMIVFFLTTDDWSSPLQLQRGHELVLKAERELGELKVKRNLVMEKLANAEQEAKAGRAALDRAKMLKTIIGSTIDQEIASQNETLENLGVDMNAITGVIDSYGSRDERNGERQKLKRAFAKRTITRNTYQHSMLNLSKVDESIVLLEEKLSSKREEERQRELAVEYLQHLDEHLHKTDDAEPVMQGITDYIPLTNQVIEMKQLIAGGSSRLNQSLHSKESLESSRELLSQSITELENTPMIRALTAPVNVLFVPYSNLHSFKQGDKLYACAFTLFWCSQVGTVGAPIGGEITTTHPFFGKPVRGQFVEANLTETSAAHKEIIHVGRPLFIF